MENFKITAPAIVFHTENPQLPQQKILNCHNEKSSTATTKIPQLPQQKILNCHNEKSSTATKFFVFI